MSVSFSLIILKVANYVEWFAIFALGKRFWISHDDCGFLAQIQLNTFNFYCRSSE